MLTFADHAAGKRPTDRALMVTGRWSWLVTGAGGKSGDQRRAGQRRHSRATPQTDRRCARLGVSLRREQRVVQVRYWRMFWPRAHPTAPTSRPPWSSDRLQLACRAQHALTFHAAQLADLDDERFAIFAGRGGLGTQPWRRARGCPRGHSARHNNVPATRPAPRPTLQTRRRSALGCCSASLISPTTILVKGGATGFELFYLQAGHGQRLGQLGGGDGGVAKVRSQDSKIAWSVKRKIRRWVTGQRCRRYWNWDRKRMSPSKNRRRSLTP